jgi:hypothetical protein
MTGARDFVVEKILQYISKGKAVPVLVTEGVEV